MRRHRWEKINEDLRTSVLDARPQLHRCKACGIMRCHYRGAPETWYWGKHTQTWLSQRPECVEITVSSTAA